MNETGPSFAGGVLAGGLSRRFGGKPKALSLWQNQTLLSHVLNRFLPHLKQVYINSNGDDEIFSRFNLPLVRDSFSNYPGPLAGIHALLDIIGDDYLLVSPCDTPLLPKDYIPFMLDQASRLLQQRKAPLLFALRTPGRTHPLHLCIHRSYKEALAQSLLNGERKVIRWLEDQNVVWIDAPHWQDYFFNINTQEDLHRLNTSA